MQCSAHCQIVCAKGRLRLAFALLVWMPMSSTSARCAQLCAPATLQPLGSPAWRVDELGDLASSLLQRDLVLSAKWPMTAAASPREVADAQLGQLRLHSRMPSVLELHDSSPFKVARCGLVADVSA